MNFSEKIKRKKEIDSQILKNASKTVYKSLNNTDTKYKNDNVDITMLEMQRICGFFGINIIFPDGMDSENIMQFTMSETGMMRRKVVLTGKWWKNASTPLICIKDGNPYALIPYAQNYIYYEKDVALKVTSKNASDFENNCYCFYKPMKNQSLSLKDFIMFVCGAFDISDIIWLTAVSLAAVLTSMIMPGINQFIFNSLIPSGTSKEIFGISVLIIGTVFIQSLCFLARLMWVMRIGNKTEILAQNAVWARLFLLPADFFKNYSAGEISERADSIEAVCSVLNGQIIPVLFGMLFSFLYLFQIISIASSMLFPSVVIILIMLFINIMTAIFEIKQKNYNTDLESKLSGIVFQLLNGITKIKAIGAETRAFGKWAEIYAKIKIMPSKILLFSNAMSSAVNFGGTIILYYLAYNSKMSVSDYIAFNTSFSLLLIAIISFSDVTPQIALLKASINMLMPIIKEIPENSGYKKHVLSLGGDIEINRIKFRYSDETPYILDEFELHIKKGEYIGIVGSSGCGKSTLVRILLGFEKPQSGSVYYDSLDLSGLDIRSVRQRIGVVLQNGKLFSGDIYSNIVVCAPYLSVDEAWEAAEKAGFADDIRNMPMGMFTMISEGGGGLSGGQQQRLLIARALAPSPDIIIFDEATSALDNITQSIVVDTLEKMECTRLVIAHRLSTIKNCSKIIYIDKGKIIESGTYKELMKLGGKFAETARRQIV